jgi:hypothetical protein
MDLCRTQPKRRVILTPLQTNVTNSSSSPIDPTVRLFVHPSHFHNVLGAKISPNSIITPLTNGKKRSVVNEPRRAMTRVLVVREESKIAVDAGGRGGFSRPWWW